MTIWPAVGINLLAAERLLLNTLSNAIRFSSNGEIEISLNSFCHDESRCDLHICVTNRRGKSVPQPIPSPIDVSPHKSDDYYGTGLGLMVSKQLASSLGGEFSFHRISINEYVTDIRVPCERADSDDVKAILYPVVLVTQNEGLASRVREILASETNVIVINRITKLRSKIAALIIDEESLNDSLHSSRSDSGFLSEHLFSLIQSRETYRCEEISSLAFNSLAFDASDYEIINTVRTQSAARENETWFDPDLASNSVAGLSGVHFLVVDDNRVNRELLEEGITNVDAHFTGAKTVSDGIHSLKSENIDVILLDWNVGIHSGNLILEHLSSLESDTRPMVFILSSESAATIQKAVVSPVVTAIIERPISIDRGLKLVSEYIHEGGLNAYNSGNSCGAKIFDINLYEELITSGSAKEKVFELLEIFRS